MNTPNRKVGAGALGGAVATVLVIIWAAVTGDTAPTGLEGALAVIFSFIAGYFVSEPSQPDDNPTTFSARDGD